MNHGGDAADQMVRMSMNGVEVIAKLTGQGAKELVGLLYAILKDQKQTKGKARLERMLRSGKELKLVALQEKDLKKFTDNAKNYGIMYTLIRGKNSAGRKDGLVDVMVRAEDAPKINRIFERFQLSAVDMAAIKTEIHRNREQNESDLTDSAAFAGKTEKPLTPEETHAMAESLVDDLLAPQPEEKATPTPVNPTNAQSDPNLSAPSLHEENTAATPSDGFERVDERPSVRKQLDEIKAARQQETVAPAKEKTAKETTERVPEAPKKRKVAADAKKKGTNATTTKAPPATQGAKHVAPPVKIKTGKVR